MSRAEYLEGLKLNWQGWLRELRKKALADVSPETWLSVAVTEGEIRLARATDLLGSWPGLLPSMATHATDVAAAGAKDLTTSLMSGSLERQWRNWDLETDGSTEERTLVGLRPASKLDRLTSCLAAVCAAVDSSKDCARLRDALAELEKAAKANIKFLEDVADASWWYRRDPDGLETPQYSDCLVRRKLYEDAGRELPWWWQLDKVYKAARAKLCAGVGAIAARPDGT